MQDRTRNLRCEHFVGGHSAVLLPSLRPTAGWQRKGSRATAAMSCHGRKSITIRLMSREKRTSADVPAMAMA